MDKEEILGKIRQCAAENGGRPLGRERFQAVTGVRESDWSGKHWVRWSDAVREAGFEPNAFNAKHDDDQVLRTLAAFIRELGHFPVEAERRMRARQDPAFPQSNTLRRLGGKAELAARVVELCDRTDGMDDVRAICLPIAAVPNPTEDPPSGLVPGFVYLMKSGRYYKIGRSNSVGRREYELAIQLPEAVELIHAIETDDAAGIERYWHERFAERRLNGEWFALTAADVKAFRRRRKFM